MPKPYPNPAINQTTDLFIHANTVTNGFFGVLIVFATFIVSLLILMNRHKMSEALAISLLITLILSAPLWIIGIVQMNIIIIVLIFTIAAVLWAVFDS